MSKQDTISELCDQLDFEVSVIKDKIAGGIEVHKCAEHLNLGNFLDESGPHRIGPVSGPFILHVLTDNPCESIAVEVYRILECFNGCGGAEISTRIPVGCCGRYYVLPAGTYDIIIPKQDAITREEGEVVGISLVVEPVSEATATILLRLAEGC